MVEGARLESVYTGNRIVGSNPTLSAINLAFSVLKSATKIDLIALRVKNYKTHLRLRSHCDQTTCHILKNSAKA